MLSSNHFHCNKPTAAYSIHLILALASGEMAAEMGRLEWKILSKRLFENCCDFVWVSPTVLTVALMQQCCVHLSVVCIVAIRCVLKSYYWQPTCIASRMWGIDWYQNEWACFV